MLPLFTQGILWYYIIIMKHFYRNIIITLFLLLFFIPLSAQKSNNQAQIKTAYTEFLVGNEEGLFSLENSKKVLLWNKGSVQKIMYANGWFFLTSQGIIFSEDLVSFEERNTGLPFNVIKEYDGESKSFIQHIHPLKDLAILTDDHRIMVTTTKDQTYITKDSGLNWKSIGFSAKTNGAKCVAVAKLPRTTSTGTKDELTVFLSHAIYGLGYIYPDSNNPKWIDLLDGFEVIPTTSLPNEIASILPITKKNEDGTSSTEIYVTQSFIPRLYKLNWEEKCVELIASTQDAVETWDGLTHTGENLAFISMDGLKYFNPNTNTFANMIFNTKKLKESLKTIKEPRCSWLPPSKTSIPIAFGIHELWMLDTKKSKSPYHDIAKDKRSIYVPASKITEKENLPQFINIIKENNLNSLVIDMKDDIGVLRYETKSEKVLEKAYVSQYAIDIENLIAKCNENDIYAIARLVVFKDKHLYKYNNNKYAVWDSKKNTPWLGERGAEEDGTITYYGEYWVDPYSEEVWEYNIEIAKELISMGFNEIQFDYIRFPTDGKNLYDAEFRWQDEGMDKESALLSFLSYARKNLDAPIGIDIYGVNGWYRSGARTGQEVDLIATYVDVICPMHYPSHYEQEFLDYNPIEERPYRVYLYGSYRNAVIAKNQAIIRPWLQAFYLPVSYDELYYDKDYVQKQVYGVRDGTDAGYMYWNNIGRYDEIQPDIGNTDENKEYPWPKAEKDKTTTIPALSNKY